MPSAKPRFPFHSTALFQSLGRRIVSIAMCALSLLLLVNTTLAQQKKRETQPETAVTNEEAAKLEAVVTTDAGTFRFEFFPDKAPKHVQQFIRLARSGYYDGSAFHRAIPRAVVQGGDPLLKKATTPKDLWGTGGLNMLAEEISDIKHVRGTVSTVRLPGKAGSDGA